jgi:3',5'-cyclic AMP phosphodiesterase CpdA
VARIPRRHIAIVPGNHDVNRRACAAYFAEQDSEEEAPVPPYFPKWRGYVAAFNEFYADVPEATFTPDEPWTLFAMPELNVVVAGLNSTLAESHLDPDHYGWVGKQQLRSFARQLEKYRAAGWLRLAAVHHNVIGGAALDEENLRHAADLDRMLGEPGLVNLVLHGHAHDGRTHFLSSGLPLLSTGSAAVDADARPTDVANQYQVITVRRDGFTRHARQYGAGQRRWIGDTRITGNGSDWRDKRVHELTKVDAALGLHHPGDVRGRRPPASCRAHDQQNRKGGATRPFGIIGCDSSDQLPTWLATLPRRVVEQAQGVGLGRSLGAGGRAELAEDV